MRTPKENLLWLRDFGTVEELRVALLEFRKRFNETWILAQHGYRAPAAIRAAQTKPAALARKLRHSVSTSVYRSTVE